LEYVQFPYRFLC